MTVNVMNEINFYFQPYTYMERLEIQDYNDMHHCSRYIITG